MGVGHVNSVPAAVAAGDETSVIKVQNEDELRLAQMGTSEKKKEDRIQLMRDRPQTRIEAPFHHFQPDRSRSELHNLVDRQVSVTKLTNPG